MDKKEAFKNFCKSHPELINSINDGTMTWQKYYEIYDIYGGDLSAWNKYLNKESSSERTSKKFDFNSLGNFIKNVDVDNIQKHISTAQKALGVIEEMTTTKASEIASKLPKNIKKPTTLNKFFED